MRRWATALAVVWAAGCAASQAQVMPGEEFERYKTAHVEALEQDEYNLYSEIVAELLQLGLEVKGGTPARPVSTDLLVTYTYRGGWSSGILRHPKELTVVFTDALSSRVVATAGNRTGAGWPSRDSPVKSAFRELREQLGYDPDDPLPGPAD